MKRDSCYCVSLVDLNLLSTPCIQLSGDSFAAPSKVLSPRYVPLFRFFPCYQISRASFQNTSTSSIGQNTLGADLSSAGGGGGLQLRPCWVSHYNFMALFLHENFPRITKSGVQEGNNAARKRGDRVRSGQESAAR